MPIILLFLLGLILLLCGVLFIFCVNTLFPSLAIPWTLWNVIVATVFVGMFTSSSECKSKD